MSFAREDSGVSVPQYIAQEVRSRAGNRCEYCQMHQSLQGATFHIEHIIPISCGGSDNLTNLCLACPGCNLRKSSNTTAPDPSSGQRHQLFNPRIQDWDEHFAINHYKITGRTPIGRAAVESLAFNTPRRLRVRKAEEMFGLFPPGLDGFRIPD